MSFSHSTVLWVPLYTWLSNPLGKLLDKARRTKLETLFVDKPRPNTPELKELAVFRLLLAFVDAALLDAPEVRLRATAANVSNKLYT